MEENMRTILISFAASSLLAALAVAQPQYTVTDLGSLGAPGTTSNAYGINALGWTSGSSNPAPTGPQHAFFSFGGGRMLDLGTLGGQKCPTCNSGANGLNAFGETA